MGVKKFTHIFKHDREVTFKDFKGKTLAVDGLIEIYRAMLGIPDEKKLTDSKGRPTVHLNTLQALVLNLYKAKVNQIWVFDNRGIAPDSCKKKELEIRRKKRKSAEDEIKKISLQIEKLDADADADTKKDKDKKRDKKIDEVEEKKILDCEVLDFLSEDLKQEKDDLKENRNSKLSKIHKLKKRTFVVKTWMINDVKFMLDKMNIKWIEAPVGYEGEHMAACLTKNKLADAVLSPDSDALVFGATKLVKRDTSKSARGKGKKYLLYTLSTLLKKNNITQSDLIKVSLCLGTDYNPKGIRGIGEKTVLKKYVIIDKLFEELDAACNAANSATGQKKASSGDRMKYLKEIRKAYDQFKRDCPLNINKIHNRDETPLADNKKLKELLDWMVQEKTYNRERVKKIIEKAMGSHIL